MSLRCTLTSYCEKVIEGGKKTSVTRILLFLSPQFEKVKKYRYLY